MRSAGWLTSKYRPAHIIASSLIIKHQFANFIGELFALPAALEPAGPLALAFRRSRARGLDRVGCGAELVGGCVRDRRRLTGSIRGMARRSAQIPGRRHRMAGCRAGLRHRDLAARPGPSQLNGVTRPRVRRLSLLEEVQDVLRTGGCPQCEEMVMIIGQTPASSNGDQSGIARFRENHTTILSQPCTCVPCPHRTLLSKGVFDNVIVKPARFALRFTNRGSRKNQLALQVIAKIVRALGISREDLL